MTLRSINVFALATVVAAFAAGLLAFTALNGGAGPSPSSAGGDATGDRARTTDERIAQLRTRVGANPADVSSYALLADAYLAKIRETEDPRFYAGAERALDEGHRRAPRSAAIATGFASLALSRHEFREGLEWGLRARRLAPDLVRPLGLIVDAQIELGRYDDAARTLQRMVDLKPGVPAYSRISYLRELHGDLPGAVDAMRLAVSAAGQSPEDAASVQALLGHLELVRGRPEAGEAAFRRVLDRVPENARALDGMADVEIARGNVEGALERWRKLSAAVPSPHYATDVADLATATGNRAEARRAIERVRLLDRRLAAAGANVASESAVFEADYGSPARALELARQAHAEAPSVQRSDALGWALTVAGRPAEGIRYAREAMRLGTRESMFLYHGAMAARAAGRQRLARTWFTRLLRDYRRFSPLHEPRARRALRSLD